VSNSSGQDVWDVAESYFNELVNRSMIQPLYHPLNLRIWGCRVHDTLLELVVKRCKEYNFLSLVNDLQAVVQVQDKAIRRLNVVGLRGAEVDTVAVTTAVNYLAQIRSLSIMGQSTSVPSLVEFKFVRVLSLVINLSVIKYVNTAVDLSVINQLSQLRYLQVSTYGKIMLPSQIRGLRLLETLDLYSTRNCSILLEIVDAPCLSHLVMPMNTRLPDWIGKAKLLRTLRGFILPMDSLEGIISLGELTALTDLQFSFPNGGCTGLSKAAWMTALSTSLDKLGNLKQLRVCRFDVFKQEVALCADALSSLSPPFRNLELLDLGYVCTFPRVPRWIGHLHSLRELYIGAKRVLEEDVALIGTRLPSLIRLSLRIPGVPTERIVIGGSTGFPVLQRFVFECDGMSFLAFEAGAMPALRELELVLDAHEWDKAAPAGLHHLLSLEKITTMRARYGGKRQRLTATGEDDTALIRSVFQEAADTLPTRPEFKLGLQKIR